MRIIHWTGLYVLCCVVRFVRSVETVPAELPLKADDAPGLSGTDIVNDKMPNDYLVSKWELWFKFLVNHNGKIAIEDVQESGQNFTHLHQMQTNEAKSVKVDLNGWWDKYIFRDNKGELSEQQFVDALNKDFVANKAKFAETMSQCLNDVFGVIDTNKDRSISEEEFLISLQAYGHKNVALNTKYFKAYNPTEGLIPLRQIVDSWIDFATSEDGSKENVVKKALESGV